MDEILSPNLEKIFENEKKNTEKECLIKKAERDKENLEMYQKGHAIYEKFSKLYFDSKIVINVHMKTLKFRWKS